AGAGDGATRGGHAGVAGDVARRRPDRRLLPGPQADRVVRFFPLSPEGRGGRPRRRSGPLRRFRKTKRAASSTGPTPPGGGREEERVAGGRNMGLNAPRPPAGRPS